MDPRASGFFLLQGCAAGDRCMDAHIVVSVHLLEKGTKPHQQKAYQGHMILFTEIHQSPGGFRLKMENIQFRIHRI